MSLAQSNLFWFNYRVEPVLVIFMFRRHGARAEPIKFELKSEAREGTEHVDCTNDGIALSVMLFVHPLCGEIICENI